MPHTKYGDKFTCFSCEAKFYNMFKPEAICPNCGTDQGKAPKKKAIKLAKPVVASAPSEEFEAEEEAVAEDNISALPLQSTGNEESFDPNTDQLAADETPDRDF